MPLSGRRGSPGTPPKHARIVMLRHSGRPQAAPTAATTRPPPSATSTLRIPAHSSCNGPATRVHGF
eukprot:1059126-Prymnesium_polylepis.1